MTLDKFFKSLEKLKDRGWRIDSTGVIRCKNGLCPIIAVVLEEFPDFFPLHSMGLNSRYRPAGYKLGLTFNNMEDIVLGADGCKTGRAGQMRKRIIEVLNLKEGVQFKRVKMLP